MSEFYKEFKENIDREAFNKKVRLYTLRYAL